MRVRRPAMRRWLEWWAAGRRQVPTRRRQIATVVLLFIVVLSFLLGNALGPGWEGRTLGVVYVLLGLSVPWSYSYWDGTNVHERRSMLGAVAVFVLVGVTMLTGASSWWWLVPFLVILPLMIVEDLRGRARRRRDVRQSTADGSVPSRAHSGESMTGRGVDGRQR